jgi:hypothetical protein
MAATAPEIPRPNPTKSPIGDVCKKWSNPRPARMPVLTVPARVVPRVANWAKTEISSAEIGDSSPTGESGVSLTDGGEPVRELFG